MIVVYYDDFDIYTTYTMSYYRQLSSSDEALRKPAEGTGRDSEDWAGSVTES